MSEGHQIQERLRRLPSASNDADWEDVLRRASASPTFESNRDPSAAHHAVLVCEGARPRGRRASRRLVFGGIGAIVTLGMAGAVILITLASPTQHTGRSTRTIHTASYTLISNTDGTATLTINPTELFDSAALQSDLAQDGIPAKVTANSFCASDPAPAGFSQVVSVPSPSAPSGPPPSPSITFHPSAIPAGAELSFGDFQLTPTQQQADVALINTSSYTCTGSPPSAGSSQQLQVTWWQPGSGSTLQLGAPQSGGDGPPPKPAVHSQGGGDGSPPKSSASLSATSGN